MKFATTLASLGLAATALAAPAPGQWKNWKAPNDNCVSREYVEETIEKAIVFLQHLPGTETASQAAAEAVFDPAIVEYGDSINSLRGDAPGTVIYEDRETYVTNTLSSPPIPQIDTLNLVVECNTFVWQWRFYGIGGPSAPDPYVQGFTLGKINEAGLIDYQYVEFNSLAWATNAGFTVEPPTDGPLASPEED